MAGARGRKPKKGPRVRKAASPLKRFWKKRQKEILAGSAIVMAVFLFGVTAGLYSSRDVASRKSADAPRITVKAAVAPAQERSPARQPAPPATAMAPVAKAPAAPPPAVVKSPSELPYKTDPAPKRDLLVSLPPPSKERLPVQTRAMAAIIIDDIGQSMEAVERLLAIGEPITLAVLPHQAHSRQAAARAMEKGQVVMLHLPMEPRGKENPGPGALLAAQGSAEIMRLFAEDMEWVPGAVGVNNHMGSLLTEREEVMAPLMEQMRERGLFFVDSMTSSATVAYQTARRAGLASAKRDVFLDNERDVRKIMEALDLLSEKALRNGSAVAIGHPYPETIRALELYAPLMAAKGVRYVPITKLLKGGMEYGVHAGAPATCAGGQAC
ncbi:MAG: divergent polysaccharide deacetylase family protein [Nitrospinota bacterium]|nr:divergent polysaccharide deacetylase family protein [Nitrospinota bacterium]